MLFQTSMIMFHVNLLRCELLVSGRVFVFQNHFPSISPHCAVKPFEGQLFRSYGDCEASRAERRLVGCLLAHTVVDPQKKLGKCHDFGHQTLSLHISRWWFQIFLLFFIPICGRLPFWLIFFDWVVQQPPIYDILLIIDYIVWLWVGLFSNKPKFRVRAAMFVCCFVEVMFQDQLFHGEMMWKQKDKIWSRDADGSSFYC